MTADLRDRAIGGIVLDIEGTTTPIAFVYEELFPFARRHLHAFLAEAWHTADVRLAVELLHEEWLRDRARGEEPPSWAEATDAIAAYVEWLMDRDRKSTGLKLLQGCIWHRGYESGELRSQMYGDVAPALRRWHAAGVALAIYSSGSALAQKLLFGHAPDGDLTPYLNRYFDTAVGPKTQPESYRAIAGALAQRPSALLFISDSPRELEAASTAGYHSLLCVRPGNPAQTAPPFMAISSFDDVIVR